MNDLADLIAKKRAEIIEEFHVATISIHINNCGNCKHWLKPSERSDYHSAVSASSFSPSPPEGYQDLDKQFGVCQAIDILSDHPPEEPLPLAVTMDASEYMADLFTQKEFSCSMHEDSSTGCCTDCGGVGVVGDGPCWSCKSTGHTHEPEKYCLPEQRDPFYSPLMDRVAELKGRADDDRPRSP